MSLLPFFIVIGAALITTGIFLFGFWKLIHTHEIAGRLRSFAEALGLIRTLKNPILTPRPHAWEAEGVLNPAAVKVGGRVHLFYRAIGNDGVSRIGYASSKDGVTFDDRLATPVYALGETMDPRNRLRMLQFFPNLLSSGGTFAGTEDPRAVLIDDRIYLSVQAFSSWSSLRIAVTSISASDLLAKRWRWRDPVYLSPEGQVHKNWVLFPEKINGKYAVLHGFVSDREHAQIEYLDTLDSEPTTPIQSSAEFRDSIDESVWDSKIRGAGPPPLKTDRGWLVLYHANDAHEPHRYKLGALLLDLNDPTKVIARSPAPVLSPDAHYENNGTKPGIVYACGAVLEGDKLSVYYGAADSVSCVATNSLSKILNSLVSVGPK